MKRLKGFCEGVTVCLCVGFCLWMQAEYRQGQRGYENQQRAALDRLYDDSQSMMDHLSVADIGLDAEMVMEKSRGR